MEFTSQDIKDFVKVNLTREDSIGSGLKFSIIMPSYNQKDFIERSIISVLNQGYNNYELIIIDGGSTDGTLGIIKQYEDYISYWVSEKDNGQSHALNKGFRQATGDIYAWLNSDDLLLPHSLKNQYEAFLSNPDKKIIFGDYYNIDKYDNIEEKVYSFDFSVAHFVYEGFHLNSQAMSWRKEVHNNFGEFDEKLHRTMDYDMILRFGLNEGQDSFKRITAPLACFRRHDAQKTGRVSPVVLAEHLYISKKLSLEKKYEWQGKMIRYIYRIRRLIWYIKRKGLLYSMQKVFKSF